MRRIIEAEGEWAGTIEWELPEKASAQLEGLPAQIRQKVEPFLSSLISSFAGVVSIALTHPNPDVCLDLLEDASRLVGELNGANRRALRS